MMRSDSLGGSVFEEGPALLRAGASGATTLKGAVAGVGSLRAGALHLAHPLASALGLSAGQRLLAVRGSDRGLTLVVKGPLADEALRHPELPEFA